MIGRAYYSPATGTLADYIFVSLPFFYAEQFTDCGLDCNKNVFEED